MLDFEYHFLKTVRFDFSDLDFCTFEPIQKIDAMQKSEGHTG